MMGHRRDFSTDLAFANANFSGQACTATKAEHHKIKVLIQCCISASGSPQAFFISFNTEAIKKPKQEKRKVKVFFQQNFLTEVGINDNTLIEVSASDLDVK